MFPKDIQLSLEGLHFQNQCLQYYPWERVSLSDLVQHTYLQMNKDNISDALRIPYKNVKFNKNIEIYGQLNKNNSILINTKNRQISRNVYENALKTLEPKVMATPMGDEMETPG